MTENVRKFKLLEVNVLVSELISDMKRSPSVLPGSVHTQSSTTDNSSSTNIACILETGLNLSVNITWTSESARLVIYEIMLSTDGSASNTIIFNDVFKFNCIVQNLKQLLGLIRQHYRNIEV